MRSTPPSVAAGSFLAVFGLAFFLPGVWLWHQQELILSTWPEVEAEGVGGEVLRYAGKGNHTFYRANYELRFFLEGHPYQIPLASKTSHSGRKGAQREAERYQSGTRHRIRYSPVNPYDIRENVGRNPSFFLLPGIFGGLGVLMIVLGVTLLVWAWMRPAGPHCQNCSAPLTVHDHFCANCGTQIPNPKPEHPEEEEWTPEERQALEAQRVEIEAGTVRRNRRGNRIGGFAFGAIGGVLLAVAISMGIQRYRIATLWPEVDALVTRSETASATAYSGERRYRPRIELKYESVGREYSSEASLEPSANYAWVQSKLQKFPVGAHCRVRYNPTDPSQVHVDAALTPEFFIFSLVLGLLGVIFTTLGLALLYQSVFSRSFFCNGCQRLLLGKSALFCSHCGRPSPIDQ